MAAPVSTGKLPGFFIVGHPKSGTTAMYEMLRAHPQIFMPEVKEPWYFATELHARTPPRPQGTPRTIEEYVRLFAGAREDQLAGEASPHYLWSRSAAAEIAKVEPDAKIIAILREPASFLRSLHLQFLQVYYEVEPDLRRALELEADRREGRNVPPYTYWPQLLLYSEHVRYAEQLRRYHDVFPREQVLVLIYEEFRADNEGTIGRVQSFLGVEESEAVAAVEANPTVQPRSQLLNEAFHAVGVGRGPISHALKESIKAITPAGPRRRAFYALRRNVVFGSPGPEDEELMAELRERYRGEVEAAGEYLERDLAALWGYERVG
ncbi:MAG: sulfotransferase family protein [Solirubrobacteraceae bacterium]